MSIDRFRLRHFRGFPEVGLELKPLTVLLGPNSSGKSSFSHPLAALSHCQTLYEGRRDASLTPRTVEEADLWPVDLGGFKDLVTSGFEEKVFIDLGTSEGWVELGFGLVPTSPDLLWLSYIALPQNVDVTSTSVSGAQSQTETSDLIIPSGESTSEVRRAPAPRSHETRLLLERINEQQWRHEHQPATVGLNGLLPLSVVHSSGSELTLNRRAITEIKSLLEHLAYLRASRKRPSRGYPRFRGEQRSVGYAGERTASILLNRGEKEGLFVFPPPAISANQGDLQVAWQERKTTLQKATSEWLQHVHLAHAVQVTESRRYGAEFLDVRVSSHSGGAMRDITEVGFGVSQALPVIVGALLQPRDSLFIVDLPEAHLHPRLQGEIAEVFCALAMCNRTSLIETHSEMFFQRLRLRAAMDPELMKRIEVYFLDAPGADGKCNLPRRVGLTFEEELKWPTGFFNEATDTELQIRSVRQARSKHA